MCIYINPPIDDRVRQPAEKFQERQENENIVCQIGHQAQQLANENQDRSQRQVSGITLKNQVSARTAARRQMLATRWQTQSEELRKSVHTIQQNTQVSPVQEARDMAAINVAYFSAIEIPNGYWRDVIPSIVGVIMSRDVEKNSNFLASCYDTIGLICENVPEIYLTDQSDSIQNAIFTGVNHNDQKVIFSSIRALKNALGFCAQNFERDNERDAIMNMITQVITNTTSTLESLETAWMCLVQIADSYYPILGQYIEGQYKQSIIAIEHIEENICQQGFEFWTCIAEHEAATLDQIQNSYDDTTLLQDEYPKLCTYAVNHEFLLILFKKQVLQPDGPDDDEWTISSAAGLCLLSIVRVAESKPVIEYISYFYKQFCNHPDWHYRDAAFLSLGCLTECIDQEQCILQFRQILPNLYSRIEDVDEHIQNTIAWTFGQITHFIPEALPYDQIEIYLQTMLKVLKKEYPKSASFACWSISNYASYLTNKQDYTSLEQYIYGQIQQQQNLSSSTNDTRLLVGCYETIADQLKNSSEEKRRVYATTQIPIFGSKQDETLKKTPINYGEKEILSTTQGQLCGAFENLFLLLTWDDIKVHSQQIMYTQQQVMQSKASIVHEEVQLSIGQFIRCSGINFLQYCDHVVPIQCECQHKQQEEPQVCNTAIMTISNLASSQSIHIEKYAEIQLHEQYSVLKNIDCEHQTRMLALEAAGDFALALGLRFHPYIQSFMPIILSVAESSIPSSDPSYIELERCTEQQSTLQQTLSTFLASIGNGYDTTDINNQQDANNIYQLFQPYIEFICRYIQMIHQDKELTNDNMILACDLIQDIATRAHLQGKEKEVFNSGIIVMTEDAKRSSSKKVRSAGIAAWEALRVLVK